MTAVLSLSAIVMPPFALICFNPWLPSFPIPVKTAPIVREPAALAADSNNRSPDG